MTGYSAHAHIPSLASPHNVNSQDSDKLTYNYSHVYIQLAHRNPLAAIEDCGSPIAWDNSLDVQGRGVVGLYSLIGVKI